MQSPKHIQNFDFLRPTQPAAPRAEAGSRPGSFSGPKAGGGVTPGLIRAGSLEEAVEALTAGGRLVPRGSLLDLKA